MNIAKLVAKGRLVPITKYMEKIDGSQGEFIIGYKRKSYSRKKNQVFWLKQPKLIVD